MKNRELLDPKLDVVFKILFTRPENEGLLKAMLTAVLEPNAPIRHLKVLNPEPPKEVATDKGIVLDIRVDLENGVHLDVEMESTLRIGFRRRVLYYWARLYSGDLRRGNHYASLSPTVSVVWLNDELSNDTGMHNIFQVLEKTTHFRLTEDLEIHILELPKFARAEGRGEQISLALRRWVRFLSSKEEVEFEQLAMEDSVMHEAKEALERISSQSEWCQIAEVRRRALDTYEIEMSAAREEGISQGISQGIVQGKAKSLLRVLERRFGLVPVWIREQIVSIKPEDSEQLEKWLDQAVTASSLEDVFTIG